MQSDWQQCDADRCAHNRSLLSERKIQAGKAPNTDAEFGNGP